MILFTDQFEETLKERWNLLAIGDYGQQYITYGKMAENIAIMHEMWKAAGLNQGDKIAINAKSSSAWAQHFFAAITGGYTSVQLFPGFMPSDTMALVRHSDTRILYTEKANFLKMKFEEMPELLGIIELNTGELLAARNGFDVIYNKRTQLYKEKYPEGITPERLSFHKWQKDDVCAIMYTSGSTGNPKGVMLTVGNFSANLEEIPKSFPYRKGDNFLSVLPFAHVFALSTDVIIPLSLGLTLTVLCIPPIPMNVKKAMCELKPRIFFCVPLIMSKFVDYTIGDIINSESGKAKLADIEKNAEFCEYVRDILMTALGGNVEAFATGGAAIPSDIESLMAFKLKVPFLTGYGMTECAPLICCGKIGSYKAKSCGAKLPGYAEIRFDSPDPKHIAGEIQVKGDCVFAGYYKNPEATASVMTEDGWFKTGDMGITDDDDTVFIVGRCKNMLLSSNGQNIYPEEIESVLNELPYVSESIIVQRKNKLYALIVPNGDAVAKNNLSAETLREVMRQNIIKLNTMIPDYSVVSGYELLLDPFAKTPKGSIKRFMYV